MSKNRFQGLGLILAGGLAWSSHSGASGAAIPTAPGACCCFGQCEQSVYIGNGFYCCCGICQPAPFGGSCNVVCCRLPNGQHVARTRACCTSSGGVVVTGQDCNLSGFDDRCELTNNDCNANQIPDECDADCDEDEIPDDCQEREACCFQNNSCAYLVPSCCTEQGGYPAGPGTTCADQLCSARACCRPTPGEFNDFCSNVGLYTCEVLLGGTHQGPNTDCKSLPRYPDGDLIPDACDNCPQHNNATQADDDGDGRGNACDNCTPGAPLFNCMPGVNCFNPDQANSDADAHGNVCDNCPTVTNPNQLNCDGDATGDACEHLGDGDKDNDGIGDATDRCDSTPAIPTGAPVGWPAGLPILDCDGTLRGDVDGDCDVDQRDVELLQLLVTWIGQTTCTGNNTYKLQACPGSGGGGMMEFASPATGGK